MFFSMAGVALFFMFYFDFIMHQITNVYSLLLKMDTKTPLELCFHMNLCLATTLTSV